MNAPNSYRALAMSAFPLRNTFCGLVALLLAFVSCFQARGATGGLSITYGAKGVAGLSFNGVVLENTTSNPADAFHIWHIKATDLAGNILTTGQYTWGEINNGETWNAATQTEIYNFSWGSVATKFVQSGNTLNIVVTETNYASSGIVLDGLEIFPFALHFPNEPAGFAGYTQYAITTTDPGVSVADFGSGVVTSVIPDESASIYGGWKNVGTATYAPLMTTTAPNGLPTFLPHNDGAVQPGSTFSYTVSLRFTAEGTAADTTDADASFAAKYPSQMTWTDKRILGTAYLASSPAGGGDITQPGGFPTNPRRYFNDSTVDVTTAAGLQAFQNRMLMAAANEVINAQNLDAQGVITWDIEGEQYPQDTSYVCSPEQIATVAPEMESTVTDRSSAFVGQKLDDAYFKTLSNAGLRIGLCLRPQVFTLTPSGTASQVFLSTNAAIIANLEKKARYANGRWGATVFYVDSTVDTNGGTLDPAIFQQLITDLPNLLFIPEESTTRYYAYTAPFYSFIFHQSLGTPASVYAVYPKAFGANLINDVSPSLLSQYETQLTQSVERGDILMGHVDYWQTNDPTLVAMYRAAGVSAPAPSGITPVLNWSTPSSIGYGTALSAAQLNATANVPGVFTYSPAAGTTLGAGTATLTATFTPSNTAVYRSTSTTVSLVVSQGVPTVSWPTPASITAGSVLSATQLNAAANVPGTFVYTPAAGSVPGVGSNQLSVTFTPADATDYKTGSQTVTLLVTPAVLTAPTITWPAPAPIPFGTALSVAQLAATANVPGSFTYSPAVGAVLGPGVQTLSVTFTPSDLTKYTSVTVTRSVNVLASTQTTLALSKGPSAAFPYILTATVTSQPAGGAVAGTVTLYSGRWALASGTLSNGVVSWPVPAGAVTRIAYGVYSGSATMAASTSATMNGAGN